MSGGLGAADKATISGLARANVEVTTANLSKYVTKGTWVGPRNRYARNTIRRLKDDDPLSQNRRRNLAQYIAGSTPLHCFDAWSYLGRALGALLAGDPHRSLHLAYYAELRAALSLLGTEGIGIFNQSHFVINQPNSTLKLKYTQGTHVAAWAALEYWSSLASSGALFAKLIRPEGIPLDGWFHPHGGAATLAPQARNWFMQWGMDLSLAAKDRDARNESSYQPDGIPRPWITKPETVVAFVTDLWHLLEPGATSAFDLVDRHILRTALITYFKGRFGKNPSSAKSSFTAFVDSTIAAQSLPSGSFLREFLLQIAERFASPIFKFSKMTPVQGVRDVFSIISRAVLLLRVATGSVADQLQNATFDKASLQFWWEAVGTARGLWIPGHAPAELHDLWKDIEDTLSNFSTKSISNFSDLATSPDTDFRSLCSAERVALWGLCAP